MVENGAAWVYDAYYDGTDYYPHRAQHEATSAVFGRHQSIARLSARSIDGAMGANQPDAAIRIRSQIFVVKKAEFIED
jgi:hypothetical protein